MDIQVNMLAVGIAVVATFFLGFIWYTPLFGKVWAKEMGMDPEAKPASGEMMKGMAFMVIGNFFLAYVLATDMGAWDIAMAASGEAGSAMMNAGMASFFIWLGFFMPVDLNAVAWEKKSWKLFGINTGYHFASLLTAAMIIAHM